MLHASAGEIERGEFRTLCRRIDARLSDETIAEAWTLVDADDSGAVSSLAPTHQFSLSPLLHFWVLPTCARAQLNA